MRHVGIDLEQFMVDPYGTGIQRVLQQLALQWPAEDVAADFVIPADGQYALLSPAQAGDLLTIPFLPQEPGGDLRVRVRQRLDESAPLLVKAGDLLSIYDTWLLPEVSYLPSVLARFELFSKCMPTAMIGYDVLPMSDPANYRFKPGTAAWVSEYFRHLATTDVVICISDYARDSILTRLRRSPAMAVSVAHPGGDHVEIRQGLPPERPRFTRLGTLEARKRPVEILNAFLAAQSDHGLEADLLFIGAPSASDQQINAALEDAVASHPSIRWVQDASDVAVHDLVQQSSAMLSVGIEGYGIPVLESIRLGTPVLFDGVQPAGEVMLGRGARRIGGIDHGSLVDALVAHGDRVTLDDLRHELDPEAVPTWSAFARGVAHAV